MQEIVGIFLVSLDYTPALSASVTIVVLKTTLPINVRNLVMKNDARGLVKHGNQVVEVEATVAVQVVAVELDVEEIKPHGVMMTQRRLARMVAL
jgi:hypothetical protein